MEQRAALAHGDHGDGTGHVLGAQGGSFEWIDGDVEPRTMAGSYLLADEQHGSFVRLALADYDRAGDRKFSELAPMALTAARSAPISLPRPANAPRIPQRHSVTRTISMLKARS